MRRCTRRIHWALGAIHGVCGDCRTNCTCPCADPECLISLPMDTEDEADYMQCTCIRCGPVVEAAVTPVDSSSESSDEEWSRVVSVHKDPPQHSSDSGPRDSWFTDPVVRDLAGDVLAGRTYLANRKSVFILALERPTARIQLSVYYERRCLRRSWRSFCGILLEVRTLLLARPPLSSMSLRFFGWKVLQQLWASSLS